MLKTIIIKELQNHFYSLRFLISLFIVVLIFGIGTPGVVKTIKTEQDQYAQFQQNKAEAFKRVASDNLTKLAIKGTNHQFNPGPTESFPIAMRLLFPIRSLIVHIMYLGLMFP